jgi:hypothetical protein
VRLLPNKRGPRHDRAGLSLLEILLAAALLGILVQRGFTVMNSATRVSNEETSVLLLEERAQLVLQRIANAIMGSNRETLIPDHEQPLSTDDIQYRIHLGVQDGEVVWSDPEMIGLEDLDNEVFWTRLEDGGPNQRVVWTNLVRPFLEGEIPNGMDDNGNGIIDEKGLSFTVDRNAVTIRMTLDRLTASGRPITTTVETTVTCRNLGDTEVQQ